MARAPPRAFLVAALTVGVLVAVVALPACGAMIEYPPFETEVNDPLIQHPPVWSLFIVFLVCLAPAAFVVQVLPRQLPDL